MTQQANARTSSSADDEISLLGLANILLRRRRAIAAAVFLGAAAGLLYGIVPSPQYRSQAIFIPQEGDGGGGASDLATAASQFGIRLPTRLDNTGWGPSVYVELLRSPELLEEIASDSFSVDGRRVPMLALLDIQAESNAKRLAKGVRHLQRKVVAAEEDKALQAVRLSVVTKSPSLSLQVAKRLIDGVNRFNLQTRKSQATAEREFIEEQAGIAEKNLREAEDRLRRFLQGNRIISPASATAFEHDRLQREVMLRQDLHSSWLKSREDARIREVRDTPVITVLEQPRLAAEAQPRRLAVKIVLGALVGLLFGSFFAVLGQLVVRARNQRNVDTAEFFKLMEQVRPSFLRRRIAP